MSSYEGKKSTDKWFPVVLIDDTDFKTPEAGKVFGDVTAKYSVGGASALTTYTVATADWKETGEGNYWLRIGAAEFTTENKYEVQVVCAGCLTYRFAVEVRDKTVAEMMDDVGTLLVRLPSVLNIAGGIVEANVKQIDGAATNGNNATLKLKKLDILNADSAGVALSVQSTHATSGHAAFFSSQNLAGLFLQSITNVGLHCFGDGASGVAARFSNDGASLVELASNATGRGGSFKGDGGASGFFSEGGATGLGGEFKGGTTSGGGLKVWAPVLGIGFEANAAGSNPGISGVGGSPNGIGIRGMGFGTGAGGYFLHDDNAVVKLGSATDGISSVAAAGGAGFLIRGQGAGKDIDAPDSDIGLGATNVGVIADGVWDEILSGHVTIGSAGKALGDIDVDVAAILIDTGTTIPASLTIIDNEIATMQIDVSAILVDTGTTLPATLATIDATVDAILVDTGTTIPASLVIIDNEIAAMQADVSAILVDTGTTLPATLTTMQTDISAILVDTNDLQSNGVKLNATGKTEVNTEVSDVLFTDTIGELTSGTPAKNPTIATGIMLLYHAMRNKKTQTGVLTEIRNDAGTVIAKAAYSDDGVLATSDKFVNP